MSKQIPDIETQDIDHLGIVAGIVDEIGIVEKIDALIGTHPLEKVSAGQVVKHSPRQRDRLLWWGIDIRVDIIFGTRKAIALFRQGMSQYPTLSTYSYFQVNRPHGRGTALLIGVNLSQNPFQTSFPARG